DRRQPSRLHGELVAMRREDRLAVEVAQRIRAVATADEDELVSPAAVDEGARQLDRDGEHADPQRSPARGDVDRETGHPMTVGEAKSRVHAFPQGGGNMDSSVNLTLPPF